MMDNYIITRVSRDPEAYIIWGRTGELYDLPVAKIGPRALAELVCDFLNNSNTADLLVRNNEDKFDFNFS